MFTVVEQQPVVAVGEELGQPAVRGAVLTLHVERPGHGRRDRLGVADDGQLDHRRRPAARRPVGTEATRQARLADPARAGQRDEALADEQCRESGQVVVAADQPCRNVDHDARGRRTSRHRPERGVVGEHLAFQRSGLRRRVETELVAAHARQLGGPTQRLGLATRAVQGEHQLAPEDLPQRVHGDEPFEVADQLEVLARSKAGLDPALGGGQAQLVEADRLGTYPAVLGQVAERRTAPPRQRLPERRLHGLGRQRVGDVDDRLLEPIGVDRAGRGDQFVP